MSKQDKKGLVPALRFPEFRGAGEWNNPTIEDFFKVGSSKRVLQKDWTTHGVPFYRTRELVSLSKGDPFSSEIFISDELFSSLSYNYGVPKEGDFLVSGVGTLGISYQVQQDDRLYFKDGNVLWLAKKSGINSTYFKYCFESDWIQSQIIGQTSKSTVGTYTIQNAKKTSFWHPPTPEEQQKIADCLSSLDALITAHTQKHQALQSYKKGLMQNLFPAEADDCMDAGGRETPDAKADDCMDAGGRETQDAEADDCMDAGGRETQDAKAETVPALRFPEFGGDKGKDWKAYSLGSICDVLNNRRKPVTSNNREKGAYPYYGASGIVDYVKEYIFDERLLLVGEDGAKWGAYEKTAFIVDGRYWVNNHAHVLKPKKINDSLLENYLVKLDISSFITGAAPPKLTVQSLKSIPVPVPSDLAEQQKIADCLSSVDDLITAQAEKIAYLKTHKKGLMQQLFPATDDDCMDAKAGVSA